MNVDARTLLARPDLADERLEGLVRAERFVQARPMRCTQAIAAILEAPDPDSRQADELLFGEGFEVLESKDGWTWGQSRRDGYVGFVRLEALGPAGEAPTHRVSALRSYGFSQPDLKSRVVSLVSMNSLVRAGEAAGGYVDAGEAGWIYADHLKPIGLFEAEAAAIAERFLGAPYLWGGRSSLGLDCSGLVQMALSATGRACARDTDQQMAAFAKAPERAELVRGDLVFWPGHMGMMLDGERMIHANAFHMAVAIEPLDQAITRIRQRPGLEVIGFRRP